ncbi:hypothetical protein Krac_5701 [Ktedonobacter racemifer DSM 44963]|uniref:Uncharacterized protein n=1 Tax=Ktedonobacter racemifer DSM 44963 TaxID=485913 RepID=D6TWN2_KTERA|nr:hypothetical protein Krac_5701 [Ktedonobacter racemifer DSM 44963]
MVWVALASRKGVDTHGIVTCTPTEYQNGPYETH